jgi:hemerythrin
MQPITWPEILETSYPEIDNDHRELIEKCNALSQLIQEQASWAKIVEALRNLCLEFTQHFRAEEKVLEATGFPRAETHKSQHLRLEEQLTELSTFASSVDGSRPEHWNAVKSLRSTLLDILFRHDLDYKSHLDHAAGR